MEIPTASSEARLVEFDLSLANIKYAGVDFVVKKAVSDLEKSPLSLDQTVALYYRALEERAQVAFPDLVYPADSSRYDSELGHIDFLGSDGRQFVKAGNSLFPDGLYDLDFESPTPTPMEQVALKAIEMLSPDDKYKALKLVIDNYRYLDDYNHQTFSSMLFEIINKSERYKDVVGYCFDKVHENKDDYRYLLSENRYLRIGWVSDLVDDLSLHTDGKWLPELISKIESDDDIKNMLGIFVDSMTFPKVINLIRGYLEETGNQKVLRVGKMLIGEDPDDMDVNFFTSVSKIYSLIDFEHYPSNEEATEYDVNLIMSKIKDGDVVLEKGCGTGRLSNRVAVECKKLGINIRILAFDESEANLEEAKKGDTAGLVEYFLSSWTDIDLKPDSVDLIIDLGRNNTHAENKNGLHNALKEPRRLLKQGGIILGDWPDPNKGEYLENKIKYMRILQSLKIPINPDSGDHRKAFPYVIDGPIKNDDSTYQYVYNRFVPQMSEMEQIYLDNGFQSKRIGAQKIFGWLNSDNIYYQYTKI